MTSTIIREFHPNDASGEDLDGYFQTRAAAVRTDTPDYPPPTYEAAIAPIQNPPAAYGKCYFWTAHSESGRVIGFGQAWFPTDENSGIARAEVLVHPEFRRRGIGIKLLDHMLDVIAAHKRGQLVGVCHAAGAGAAWCAASDSM